MDIEERRRRENVKNYNDSSCSEVFCSIIVIIVILLLGYVIYAAYITNQMLFKVMNNFKREKRLAHIVKNIIGKERNDFDGVFIKYESEFDILFPNYLRNGEVLAESLSHGEGPLFIEGDSMKTDKLLFSDTIANRIYQFTYGNGVELFLNNSGTNENYNPEIDIKSYYYKELEPGSNGLTSHPFNKSIIFMCEHGDRRVSYLDLKTKKKYNLTDRYNDKRFNSPNDIIYSKKTKSLYFTDPPYGLPLQIANDPEGELGYEGIFRIELNEDDNTAKSVHVLAKMNKPNGIAFSPDESKLYVSSSDDSNPAWYVFDVNENGLLANKREFYNADHLRSHDVEGLPDGLKVDQNGYIYATGLGGLHIFHPDGRRIGMIRFPEAVSNVAFGRTNSINLTEIFIVGKKLYRFRSHIPKL